jgi:hypothetical protein
MHLPTLHEETDLTVLQDLIRARPLGTWRLLGRGDPRSGEMAALVERAIPGADKP